MSYEQIIERRQAIEIETIATLEEQLRSIKKELNKHKRMLKSFANPKFKETLQTALSMIIEMSDEEREQIKSATDDRPAPKKRGRKPKKVEIAEPIEEPIEQSLEETQAPEVVEPEVIEPEIIEPEVIEPEITETFIEKAPLNTEHTHKFADGTSRPWPLVVNSDGTKCMTVENWNPDLPERFTTDDYLKMIGFKFYPTPEHPAPARQVIDGNLYMSTLSYDTRSQQSDMAYMDAMSKSPNLDDDTATHYTETCLFTLAHEFPGRTVINHGDYFTLAPEENPQDKPIETKSEPEPEPVVIPAPKKRRGRPKKNVVTIKESDIDDTDDDPQNLPKLTKSELLMDNYSGEDVPDKDYNDGQGVRIPLTTPEELYKGEEVPPLIERTSENDAIEHNAPCYIAKKNRPGYTAHDVEVLSKVFYSGIGCLPMPDCAGGQHPHVLGLFGRNIYVRGISSNTARIIEYMAKHIDVNFKTALEELAGPNYIWNLQVTLWRMAMDSLSSGTHGALQLEFYIQKELPDGTIVCDNDEEFCGTWDDVGIRLVKLGRLPKNLEECYQRELKRANQR
jgi:hypothetical protein